MVKPDYKSNQHSGLPKSNFQNDPVRSEAEAEIDEHMLGSAPNNSVAEADHGSGPSTGEPSPSKRLNERPHQTEYNYQNQGHTNPQDVVGPDMAENESKGKLEKELREAMGQLRVLNETIADT